MKSAATRGLETLDTIDFFGLRLQKSPRPICRVIHLGLILGIRRFG